MYINQIQIYAWICIREYGALVKYDIQSYIVDKNGSSCGGLVKN